MRDIEPIARLSLSEARSADQNQALVYLSSLGSDRSRRVMRIALRTMVALFRDVSPDRLYDEAELVFPWEKLEYQHVQALRTRLSHTYDSSATINRHLSALRGVCKQAMLLDLMDADTYVKIKALKGVKNEQLPAGRDVPSYELRALLHQCLDDGNIGVRDHAILAMLATTGLRREEIVSINIQDIDADWSFVVTGKGHKERRLYLRNRTRESVQRWLKLRGATEGPLFVSIRKNGKLSQNRLSAQAIYNMLQKRGKQAGLKHVTPHDLRRTLVGDLLEAGVDAVTVSNITGHASVEMVKRYDRRPEQVKADAMSKIDLP